MQPNSSRLAWRTAVEAAGGNGGQVGGHADLAETSIMLAVRPDRVNMAAATPGRVGVLTETELADMWRNGLRTVSPTGILGDPRGATASIGEACLAAVADLVAARFASASTP